MSHPSYPESYSNAPLAIVALEVRFTQLASEAATRRARSTLREFVRDRLPLLETVTHREFAIRPDAPPSVEEHTFPRFAARDKTAAFVVTTSSLVVETTSYAGFPAFLELVERCVTGVEAALAPDGFVRVGLRYVDEIRVPSVTELPGDWYGYIDDHLLAAVESSFLPQGLIPTVWEGVVRYRTDNDTTLALRYGPREGYAVEPKGATRRRNPPAPGPFFLLDSDSYWEAHEDVPEFVTSEILSTCDRLHGPVRAIFERSITDRLREEVLMMASDNEETPW